ncbi:hypothetical protein DPMN_062645 [Dreissena polymorpha]|uniref:Uncharacterized protein n=1 Tax=Dreissena polymorpha TaxID=45954 RepID=A0A9D4CA61_DREPO|nr:hypothetical protein DPMN_062645 [Dreissena polymorpha]
MWQRPVRLDRPDLSCSGYWEIVYSSGSAIPCTRRIFDLLGKAKIILVILYASD